MIDWTAAKARTLAMTASVFDRALCRMLPMVAPAGGRDLNAAPVPDAGRSEFDFLATLDLEPSQDSIPRHLSVDPAIDAKIVAYDAVITAMTDTWPYLPKRRDRVSIGADLYEIVLDRRDGSPRMAFYINRVK
jgi:hypothetical protein